MKYFIYLFLLSALAFGCQVKFNMTGGGTVDPNLKSMTIANFTNESRLNVPYLAQQFTQELRDRFRSQSRLSLSDANGDIQLSGAIVDYMINPVAISGGTGGATQNRLEITVKVKYENMLNPKENWEKPFKAFFDFPQSTDLASNEQKLISQVTEQLTQNIFTESLGKW
ncbi:MAG: LptE family protein [Bacteroidia bacterium]